MSPKVFIHFSLFFWGLSQRPSAIAFAHCFLSSLGSLASLAHMYFHKKDPHGHLVFLPSTTCSRLLIIVSPHFTFYSHSHLPLSSDNTDKFIPPSSDALCRTKPDMALCCGSPNTQTCHHVLRMSKLPSLWVQWQQVLASISLCKKIGNGVDVHKKGTVSQDKMKYNWSRQAAWWGVCSLI